MLTGYNTDVSYRERAYHVQTEDKGVGNPYIESLIYVGGQVVAAKRTGYAPLLEEGRGKDAIVAMMDHQHQAMIAAIRAGRFDARVAELFDRSPKTGVKDRPITLGGERSLDEVILDYLVSESQQDHLELGLDEGFELGAGKRARLTVRAQTSREGVPVGEVEVTFKLISTTSAPRVLQRGRTDALGALTVDFDVPLSDDGTSALIITGSSALGSSELKLLL
jgi:hypothetical protein